MIHHNVVRIDRQFIINSAGFKNYGKPKLIGSNGKMNCSFFKEFGTALPLALGLV